MSGSPASGTTAASVTATYLSNASTGSRSGTVAIAGQSITVNQPPSPLTLSCTPTAGPTQVGVAYSATCTASGGTAPYGWAIAVGLLPAGLTLNGNTGTSISVSGTPSVGGPYAYAIKVTDSTTPTAQTASRSYSGIVGTTLTLTCTPTIGPTRVGVAYSATCTASGGTAPYNWSVNGGLLPAGLTLSGTTGGLVTISGTPAASARGDYGYTITVTDRATPTAQTASKSFSGSIAPPPPTLTLSCTTTSGPTLVGAAYSATCTVTGGTPPYNWSITGGVLPGGLTLSATTGSSVTISGNPTASGPYSYTITVSDTTTPTAQTANSTPFSGVILTLSSLRLTCTPANGPSATGTPYSAACTAVGGTLPYGWSVGGTLPAGLSLSATTGASVTISGTPTVAGNYSYTIKVTDSGAPAPQTASQPYSGVIPSI